MDIEKDEGGSSMCFCLCNAKRRSIICLTMNLIKIPLLCQTYLPIDYKLKECLEMLFERPNLTCDITICKYIMKQPEVSTAGCRSPSSLYKPVGPVPLGSSFFWNLFSPPDHFVGGLPMLLRASSTDRHTHTFLLQNVLPRPIYVFLIKYIASVILLRCLINAWGILSLKGYT